jgi:uncharacterized membrane protein YraQ (UPF0718 family)
MSITVVFINLFALGCLVYAFSKDRAKAKQSLLAAGKSFVRLLPTVLLIIVIIGLFLAFVPPERVARFIGEQAGLAGILVISAVGAVLHIPALTSFPLAASLLQRGASIAAVAAFITTLTMVGMVTLPLEIKELGQKMALLRNGFSFLMAILIALLMGVIL